MTDSLDYDERALILGPPSISGPALSLLDQAGIQVHATATLEELSQALGQGAGLAIIAQTSLNGIERSPLPAFFVSQPHWSDLPVVLLSDQACSDKQREGFGQALGNLFHLQCPYAPCGLLDLTQASLRARRLQYRARDHGAALSSQYEEQLRHLRQQEQQLRQAQKMEAIGQLAGGVAHDFNNLLTGIGGSLELMRRRLAQGRPEELPRLLDLGLNAVQRAASMTHRLLAFSSRQPLDALPVPLDELLADDRLQALLNPQIRLDIQLDNQLWQVQADAQQLQEAIDNLLSNARDAMPNGGTVQIRASNRHVDQPLPASHPLASGDYVHLSISDDGCGMPQSTLDRAFDPFFTTKPIGQGTGLGLSMVYGFMRQSQGHVAIYSRIGQGTRVELLLPRQRGEQPEDNEAQAAPGKAVGDSRVLIVEDDATVRLLVRESLEEQGYLCQEAADATLALPLLRSHTPIDLLVSDVGLPGMNGRQLAEVARTLRPGLKVLFITGYAENATARMGFLDPGMQMINKPFHFQQLQATVAQMLGRDDGR